MRLARPLLLALLAAGLLAGCGGSPDYASGAKATVSKMRSILSAYNGTPQQSLVQTGRACRQAADQLVSLNGAVEPKGAPAQYQREAQALHQGYQLAIRGFTDCSRGALQGSYPLMTQSDAEIAAANTWLQKAAQLDHA